STVFMDPDNASGEWVIGSGADTEKDFPSGSIGPYLDLSAKLFKIDFKYTDFESGVNLNLTADGGVNLNPAIAVLAFAFRDGRLEPFNAGGSRSRFLEIPDIRNYLNAGVTKFLVAVVNSNTTYPSFDGEADIGLTARLTQPLPSPDFNRCGIVVQVTTHTTYTTPDTSYERDSNGVKFSSWAKYEGGFSGNTFTGGYSSTIGTLVITGSITVVFSDDHQRLLSVDWTETKNAEVVSFSGSDIPFYYQAHGTHIFQVEGQETCGHISSLSHAQSVSDGLSYSMRSYDCLWQSMIYVSFSKE
ncbi:hypothetical protein JW906_15445, partial [bacterium]|nr:hypothetical protein [bacterium]